MTPYAEPSRADKHASENQLRPPSGIQGQQAAYRRAMEQLIAMGMEEGMASAMGQIDGILTTQSV